MKLGTIHTLVLTGLLTQSALAQDTLYQQLGGQAGVAHIVEELSHSG